MPAIVVVGRTCAARRQEPVEPPAISVLFEDDAMMVLDKPSGAVVHPGRHAHQQGTLLQELHRLYPGPAPQARAPARPVHLRRADRGASNDAVRTAFSDMLERGEVFKVYDALVLGRPAWEERTVDAPIGAVGDSRILMRVDEDVRQGRAQ